MSAQSDRLRRQLEQHLADTNGELANRMLTKLRDRTPVRTGETRSRWTPTESGSAIEIDNDARDVIARLNDGSSTQAPAGFIEICRDEALDEMQAIIAKPVKIA